MPIALTSALVESLESDHPEAANGTRSDEDVAVAALTGRLVAGEDAAWEEFHARYFDRLLRYLFVLCRGEEQAARDGLQAAFVKITRHVRRFDREDAWWGWLTVVAKSCVIDGVRGRSRYAALLERYAGIFYSPPEPAREDLLPRLLDECLAALPDDERALLVARYIDGESTAILAARAGCSGKAIESRLARLRGRLKNELHRRLRHEN